VDASAPPSAEIAAAAAVATANSAKSPRVDAVVATAAAYAKTSAPTAAVPKMWRDGASAAAGCAAADNAAPPPAKLLAAGAGAAANAAPESPRATADDAATFPRYQRAPLGLPYSGLPATNADTGAWSSAPPVGELLGQAAASARGRCGGRSVGRQLRPPARAENRGASWVGPAQERQDAGGGASGDRCRKRGHRNECQNNRSKAQRRTSTIAWNCAPVRSASNACRRWAGAARVTSETCSVSRATSAPASGRSRVSDAAARAARSTGDGRAWCAGAAATRKSGRQPAGGTAGGTPAAPAGPPAAAARPSSGPRSRRRPKRATKVHAPPAGGVAAAGGRTAPADAKAAPTPPVAPTPTALPPPTRSPTPRAPPRTSSRQSSSPKPCGSRG